MRLILRMNELVLFHGSPGQMIQTPCEQGPDHLWNKV